MEESFDLRQSYAERAMAFKPSRSKVLHMTPLTNYPFSPSSTSAQRRKTSRRELFESYPRHDKSANVRADEYHLILSTAAKGSNAMKPSSLDRSPHQVLNYNATESTRRDGLAPDHDVDYSVKSPQMAPELEHNISPRLAGRCDSKSIMGTALRKCRKAGS